MELQIRAKCRPVDIPESTALDDVRGDRTRLEQSIFNAGSQRFVVFVQTVVAFQLCRDVDAEMVGQVLADTRQIVLQLVAPAGKM